MHLKKVFRCGRKKASRKGYSPVSYKEMKEALGKTLIGGNKIEKLEKLNKVKVGKWTLIVGNEQYTGEGIAKYSKHGSVTTCLALVRRKSGKVAFRMFPFRRFMNWEGTKVK